MSVIRGIFFVIVFITLLSELVIAQSIISSGNSSSSNNTKTQTGFVSIDGEFSINLPSNVSGYRPLESKEGASKGGNEFSWKTPTGSFLIAFADLIISPESSKTLLETTGNLFIEKTAKMGGALISKKEITIDNNRGLEIRMQLNGGVGISRLYLVKNRLYSLVTAWKNGEDGELQLKILNSFKLIDGKAIVAKRVAEATPQALPQAPIFKKLKSDVEDDGMKGKVKSVSLSKEDLTGTWSVSGIKMSIEDFYDEKGNKIKQIFYDYKGNPNEITVYGFIDGMRVSNSGTVNYEDNPTITVPFAIGAKPNSVAKPADTRYKTKYEYKYDENKRLKEIIRYRNNGEILRRTVFSYNGNKLEEVWLDGEEGKSTFKSIETYDNKSNLIEQIFIYPNSSSLGSKYAYTYESFDEIGNWTKRIVKGLEGGKKEQHYIEYRAIIYYP
jgi:hypothetical protein